MAYVAFYRTLRFAVRFCAALISVSPLLEYKLNKVRRFRPLSGLERPSLAPGTSLACLIDNPPWMFVLGANEGPGTEEGLRELLLLSWVSHASEERINEGTVRAA